MAVPSFLYGTAWKEERTERLVREALLAGFRGIDTANQRKHYHEAGVGAALAQAFREGLVARDDLFLQTKFTHARGQDHRLPYDPRAPLATQVRRSFESSLAHLHVDRIDAYLLHGPSVWPGLAEADLEAWRAMEDLQREGRVGAIGVSNVDAGQLRALLEAARVPPAYVQDRTFTRPGADAEVRRLCASRGVVYQGFSLLTAIPDALLHPAMQEVARAHEATPAQVVFAWCLGEGIVPLTGTSSRLHMEQDLAASGIALSSAQNEVVARLVGALHF